MHLLRMHLLFLMYCQKFRESKNYPLLYQQCDKKPQFVN